MDSNENQQMQGIDISRTGLGITISAPFPVGAELLVSMPTVRGGEEAVDVKAVVMWSKADDDGNSTAGIRFINVPYEAREVIETLVSEVMGEDAL